MARWRENYEERKASGKLAKYENGELTRKEKIDAVMTAVLFIIAFAVGTIFFCFLNTVYYG